MCMQRVLTTMVCAGALALALAACGGGDGGGSSDSGRADAQRAIVDAAAVGFVKVSADRKGRIMGATVVARGGGDLIVPFVLAKQHGLNLSAIANTIFPYPTMAEGVKRASAEFLRSRLDTPAGRTLKRVIQWLK